MFLNAFILTALTGQSIISLVQAAPSDFPLNITIHQPNVPFVPTPLPPPGPASNFEEIIRQFNNLDRSTTWHIVKNITVEGDTGEPESMISLGEERFLLGNGYWTDKPASYGNGTLIDGFDRPVGAGYSHLAVYDGQGKIIADVVLNPTGDPEYHIGGIDYDGQLVWATLSEYRPKSTATIITIDPVTLEHKRLFSYGDHLGGIVHDKSTGKLTTLSWGSRNGTLWDLKNSYPSPPTFAVPDQVVKNPQFYNDYQDCKFLGHSKRYHYRAVAMCSGVASFPGNITLGGLAIVDTETLVPLAEIPVPLRPNGRPITQNPFDVDIVDGKLRMYFAPDQHNTTIYVVETR